MTTEQEQKLPLRLSDVRRLVGGSQGFIQRRKSRGELGDYNYAEYNDYTTQQVWDFLDAETQKHHQELNRILHAKECLLALAEVLRDLRREYPIYIPLKKREVTRRLDAVWADREKGK